MTLRRIQPGGPLSAAGQNEVIDQLNRGFRPGAAGQAQYGAAGITFHAPAETRIALFELTSPLLYPQLAGLTESHLEIEPTPYTADAKLVWCHQFDPDDEDDSGNPLRSYGGTGSSRGETLYHPTAIRESRGYAIGLPRFAAGDRVFCAWNRQSGRWEIIAPPLSVWRFELKAALDPGSHAAAYLLRYTEAEGYGEDLAIEFTVYDTLGHRFGRARTSSVEGAQGYAQFMPDSGRWEILDLRHQARWIHFQLTTALGNLFPYASATVLKYWDGYNPDPSAAEVTVYNMVRGDGANEFSAPIGARGYAVLDETYGATGPQYRVVQVEC